MAEILVVVDEMIFLAKIQQTAKLIGVAVQAVSPAQLEARLAQAPPRAVIVDLNHRSGSALEVVRKLKLSTATAAVPVVGFLSHVQGDLAVAAREAGCDVILARSAFTRDLPQLLAQYA